MDLFLQIVVFLIVAAALGFAVGWLVRGARLQGESNGLADDWRARLGSVEGERDRLQDELAAARNEKAALERAQRGAEERAAAGDPELKARATRLERELEQTRAANAKQRAEIERLEARAADLRTSATSSPAPGVAAAPSAAAAQRMGTDQQAAPPPSLTRPEGEPDDLKRISGIGPGIEKTLHDLGIFHFRQIAAFTPENVAWVNQHLRFRGRIEREEWISQARRLIAES